MITRHPCRPRALGQGRTCGGRADPGRMRYRTRRQVPEPENDFSTTSRETSRQRIPLSGPRPEPCPDPTFLPVTGRIPADFRQENHGTPANSVPKPPSPKTSDRFFGECDRKSVPDLANRKPKWPPMALSLRGLSLPSESGGVLAGRMRVGRGRACGEWADPGPV